MTVLGLVLELTTRIRTRQWKRFDPLQNTERILVNILAMDERPRGARFRQTRRHEAWPEHLEKRPRVWHEVSLLPMRITLEQYELARWWLTLDLAEDRFPPSWCREFV